MTAKFGYTRQLRFRHRSDITATRLDDIPAVAARA
jgi:hypothetical protein